MNARQKRGPGRLSLCMGKIRVPFHRSSSMQPAHESMKRQLSCPRHRSEIACYQTMQGRPLLPKFPPELLSSPARAPMLRKQNGFWGLLEATLEGKWASWAGPLAVEGPYLCYLRCGHASCALELSKGACCEAYFWMTLRAKVCEWWGCSQCEAFAQTQSRRKRGAQREAQRWKRWEGSWEPADGSWTARTSGKAEPERASFRDPFPVATRIVSGR